MTNAFPTAPPAPLPTAPAPVVAPEQIDVNAVIQEWYAARTALANAKTHEMELRKQIEHSQLFDQGKVKGTQNYQLGKGYILKLNRREDVKIENKQGQASNAVLALRNLGGLAAERADNIFAFTPRMSQKVYDAMTPEERAIVDPLITRKQGSPTLELKEPKPETE